ncbi:MAG: hypothetical protein ACQEQ0_01130 [Bacteroidota bacterium]
MWILLISILIALGASFIIHRFSSSNNEAAEEPEVREVPVDCCGAHEICEKEGIASETQEAIYYNDEELDQFHGKSPEQYTASEKEQFREVLFTMHPHEVQGWLQSLMKRGVKLPPDVREEALNIIKQFRSEAATKAS